MKSMSDMNETKRLILYLIFMTIVCSIVISCLFKLKYVYEIKYNGEQEEMQNNISSAGMLGTVPTNSSNKKLIEFEDINECVGKDFISYLYADEHLKNIVIKGEVQALDDSIISDITICSEGKLTVYNKSICKNILLHPKATINIELFDRLKFIEFVNDSSKYYFIPEINEKCRTADNKFIEIPGKFVIPIEEKISKDPIDDLE